MFFDRKLIIRLFLLFSLLQSFNSNLFSQTKNKIAVFIPIYLDEAFEGNTFKIWNNKFPKNMLQGLEFYNGAMTAIEELKKTNKYNNLEFTIYDYKSNKNSLQEILNRDSNKLASSKLIVACVNARNDIKLLADFALNIQVPVVSATYPNDGGVTNNPYFFLLNSTINTHCNALYNCINIKHKKDNIIYLTRVGAFEDMLTKNFKHLDSNGSIKFSPITLTDTFYSSQLVKYLDSNKINVILCATVNESFALHVASVLSMNKKYKSTVYGMPTWDEVKNFDKKDYAGIEFVHTTPVHFDRSDSIISMITKNYKEQFDAKPSDQFLKGYETTIRFGKIVSLYGENALQLFSEDMFKVFNSLNIEPVYNKQDATKIDYYENQNILFISRKDGVCKVIK